MRINAEDIREVNQALDSILPEYGHTEAIFTYQDGTTQKKRLARSSMGGFITMASHARNYGFDLNHALRNCKSIDIKTKSERKESDAEKWEKSWTKVLNRLQASGLWQNWQVDIKQALEIGYEKIRDAYHAYWWGNLDGEVERVKAVEPRLIRIDKNGAEHVETNILFYMKHPARVKKMYFCRGEANKVKLAAIQKAMTEKQEFTQHGRTGYDVSFSYKPDLNKAWYSEEYKNCGNGHYYLAIDSTHAVFYEDD